MIIKLLIINKSFIYIFLLFITCLVFFTFSYLHYNESVYKDRVYWEKTGDIVWEVNTDKKLIALTFDDGPSPTFTEKILDLLKKYEAKATFFIMGKQVEKYPDIVLRELQEGHELGNHTYNHTEANQMSEIELKKELRYNHQLIYDITGVNMKLFRPTSGFYDKKIVNSAKSLNYTVIIWTWNNDSRDWAQLNGKDIAKRLIKNIKPGSIILFHDQGGNRTNTINALHILLPVLKEKGYKFITISELLTYNQI